MAAGTFLKGFPIANVNGTYNCLNPELVGTDRIWESVDKLYRMRYKPLDFKYYQTEDTCFVAGKKYYRLVNAEFVLDVEYHDTIELTSKDVYYERTPVGRWEIVPTTVVSEEINNTSTTPVTRGTKNGNVKSSDDESTNSTNKNNYVYAAELDDETIVPYHPGVVWEDAEGVVVTTASIDYWDESSFSTTTSNPVVDEAAGTVTTVTTTTNLVTGDVYRETNVVRTKDVFVQKSLVRYDNMNLSVGKVYRFKFISDFESLGYVVNDDGVPVEDQKNNSGIYKLEKVTSYLDLVSSGIDLYANLYQPLGIKKEVYESDVNRLADSFIYKLIDPTDTAVVIYMPQIFVKDVDPSVEKYNKLLLAIDLGVYGDDPDMINEIEYTLSRLFEKKWGIVPQEGNKLATVTIYDSIWLTISEKEKLDNERKDIMQTSTISFSDLFNLEYTNQVFIENRRLKGRVKALEDVFVKQFKQQQ